MKRTALTGLFLTAALLASPVFAADDLCGTNLQKLDDNMTSGATKMDADTKKDMDSSVIEAKAAQAAGNDKKCIEITTKALQADDREDTGGEGNAK